MSGSQWVLSEGITVSTKVPYEEAIRTWADALANPSAVTTFSDPNVAINPRMILMIRED